MVCHVLATVGSAFALAVTAAPQSAWPAAERSPPPHESAAVHCAPGGAGYRCMAGRPAPTPATMIWIYPVCTDALTDGCLDRVEAIIPPVPLHRATRHPRAD